MKKMFQLLFTFKYKINFEMLCAFVKIILSNRQTSDPINFFLNIGSGP